MAKFGDMKKTTSTVPAVTKAASLPARSIARIEAAAHAVHVEASGERGFQAVSSKEGFSAVMVLIEIQGDDFAVRQTD